MHPVPTCPRSRSHSRPRTHPDSSHMPFAWYKSPPRLISLHHHLQPSKSSFPNKQSSAHCSLGRLGVEGPSRNRDESNSSRLVAMAKVHPNAAAVAAAELTTRTGAADQEPPEPPTVLTVWRKSLLFNCDGFTVYDAHGDLAFRVDCYAASRRRHAEVVLMDASGAPLLTVRRKRLSLADRWDIYDGADAGTTPPPRPLLSVRRHVGGLHSSGGGKTLAHVAMTPNAATSSEAFVIEGSYGRRACAVRDARGDVVAEVRRKEAVGDDVFRLVVSPRFGVPLAMGIVIALDEMFAGRRSSARSWLRSAW